MKSFPVFKVLPIAILCVSLAVSLAAWQLLDRSFQDNARSSFTKTTQDITGLIVNRLHDHEQVLLGGTGLFNANQEVTRDQWRRYVSSLRLDKNHPGILGVGYSIWLSADKKEATIRAVRAEGFPEYTIKPEGARPFYSSIIFLEPFNWRNQRAFGYDMYTEPVRRMAMDKAMESGNTTIAAKIILLQETDQDKQSGMLMYAPLYRSGMAADTPESRRRAFRGFVYSPIRMNDFIYGTLSKLPKDVAFEIYADKTPRPEALMFSSLQTEKIITPADFIPDYSRKITIDAYGTTWCLTYTSLPAFSKHLEKTKSYSILCFFIMTSFLLSAICFQLMNARNRALALAEEMTYEVREQQERLEQLNKRYELAANAGGIGIWDWFVHENRLVWDDRMYSLYGTAPDCFCDPYDAWLNCVHPDDRCLTENELQRTLSGEKSFNVEFRVIRPDGAIRYLSGVATLERDENGTPLRMTGINCDITARRMAEQLLSDEHEILQLILDSAAEAIYGIGMQGECTFCNQACLGLLGYDSQLDLTGKNMHDLIHHHLPDGSHLDVTECRIFRAFQQGESVHADNEVFWRKDGTSFPCEYWSYPQRKDGEIVGAVVTFFDITARKKAERELLAAKQAAEAASRAKSEFLANMSHELRTPMNGVLGMAQLLEFTTLDEEQRGYLHTITTSGTCMVSLINDILDLSQIEAEMVLLTKNRFSLRNCIHEIDVILRHQAQSKKLAFTVTIPPEIPDAVIGDLLRIRQILINLLGNAIKFTESGAVNISLQIKDRSPAAMTLEFSISDTGIGIRSDALDSIFQPFVQADGSSTRSYGGSGLGLTICKRLTELMGGTISAESVHGLGSTFRVLIPLEISPLEPAQTEQFLPVFPQGSITPQRILLAEDNPVNALFARKILSRLGHAVSCAENGELALRALDRERFDLVLMDIQMPVVNGEEALAAMRSRKETAAIPVIALTAFALKGEQEKFLAAGFDGYVQKPIKIQNLIDEVERVILAQRNSSTFEMES